VSLPIGTFQAQAYHHRASAANVGTELNHPMLVAWRREFWEAVSTPPLSVPHLASIDIKDDALHRVINQTRALGIMMFGAPHFSRPVCSRPCSGRHQMPTGSASMTSPR
jgi:hypothetical protein